MSCDDPALSGKDGVLPTRCELVGSGRGQVVIPLVVSTAASPSSAPDTLICARALHMPALVAIRFNADMKTKYQALRAAGKPPKVAITAVMRKLAILANALLREQRKWTPKTA